MDTNATPMGYTMHQLARKLGISYFTLRSAVATGHIEEPACRIGATRLFNPHEADKAADYFSRTRRKRGR